MPVLPKGLDDSNQTGEDKKNAEQPNHFWIVFFFPVLPVIASGIAGQRLERNGILWFAPVQDFVRLMT